MRTLFHTHALYRSRAGFGRLERANELVCTRGYPEGKEDLSIVIALMVAGLRILKRLEVKTAYVIIVSK